MVARESPAAHVLPIVERCGPVDARRGRESATPKSSAAPRWFEIKGADMDKNTQSGISIVTPRAFDPGTSQTPGSERLAAISASHGIASPMWGGLFVVAPGGRTAIHHHGEQHTIAYVLAGTCLVRWGARGEFSAEARCGDFLHVPAWLPHMEINPSSTEPFRWVVVRSTPVPIVVNLPDACWEDLSRP
jgi:uncharacterized RmlC-like cupin family protein